jgi:hypothetical protein
MVIPGSNSSRADRVSLAGREYGSQANARHQVSHNQSCRMRYVVLIEDVDLPIEQTVAAASKGFKSLTMLFRGFIST